MTEHKRVVSLDWTLGKHSACEMIQVFELSAAVTWAQNLSWLPPSLLALLSMWKPFSAEGHIGG